MNIKKRIHRVYLRHDKNTAELETIPLPLPRQVSISMSQTMGAPCTPTVKKGDSVAVGQKIGQADAPMSAPVHSSVSGFVSNVSDYITAQGKVCKTLIIDTDGLQSVSEEVLPPVVTDRESFLRAVRESGACGLGGAGFPTHLKLSYDPEKTPIDTLVINAAECEPYITSDYRELMENPSDVYEGIQLLMKYCEIPNARLCIENNKPAAIQLLKEMAADNPKVEVVELPSAYPQGAEKMIVYSATGRIIQEGQLPSHQGVLVMNVSTTAFLAKYLRTGMPLVSRRMTVDGTAVERPGNFEVRIGAAVSELLDYVGAKDYCQVISGGPMMGTCLYDINMPVTKTCNALLAMKEAPVKKVTNCIRCGRCLKACPMNLMPTELEKAYDRRDVSTLQALRVGLCMNCGSCTYICPAGRSLAEKNQLAKALLPRP